MVVENWSLCLQTFEGHSKEITQIAWSPDGSRLASASDVISIWDLATEQTISILEQTTRISTIVWSPDGSQLASACLDTIKIWHPTTGQTILVLEHTCFVTVIAWSPDGSRLASASFENTVEIWDLGSGQTILILEYVDLVTAIAWSPDGSRLASASTDKTVRIWDLATGQTVLRLEHYRSVSAIAWSLDGSRLASASYGGMVTIWNAVTGQIMSALEGHKNRVESIAWQQNGNRLASASDEAVRIWDPATGQIAILEGHEGVTSLAWSHDGNRLASASDDAVRIWNPATGQCASTIHINSPINSPSLLKFDAVDSYKLHTNNGTLDIGPVGSFTNLSHWPTLPDLHGYGLKDDKSWITYNGVKILWLPVEYRFAYIYPSSTLPAKLVIGCSIGGRCIFLILAEPNDMAGPSKVGWCFFASAGIHIFTFSLRTTNFMSTSYLWVLL